VGVERLAVQLADGKVADERADVRPDDLLVAAPRCLLDVEELEVAVHQLVDGGLRARAALLVDLVDQASADLLRLGGGARPGSNRQDLWMKIF
jgi:hypothetical protein